MNCWPWPWRMLTALIARVLSGTATRSTREGFVSLPPTLNCHGARRAARQWGQSGRAARPQSFSLCSARHCRCLVYAGSPAQASLARPPPSGGADEARRDMSSVTGFASSRRASPIRSRAGATGTARGTSARSRKAPGPAQDVEALQHQCETYTKRIEMEKRRGEELEKKLAVSCGLCGTRSTDAAALSLGHALPVPARLHAPGVAPPRPGPVLPWRAIAHCREQPHRSWRRHRPAAGDLSRPVRCCKRRFGQRPTA